MVTSNGYKKVKSVWLSWEIYNWLTDLKITKEENFDSVLRRIKNKEVNL
jgi:hypothetical protein